jgi:catechol 2,3-dioxygenase-like lactoylglutathione lyase family enzyme
MTDEWIDLAAPSGSSWIAHVHDVALLGDLAVDHVGIAVHDVEQAAERFGALFGIGNWVVTQFCCAARGEFGEHHIGGRTATAALGPIAVELVQPTEGRWTAVEVLERVGEGLYHVGFRVPDLPAALAAARAANLRVELVGLGGNEPIFAYVAGASIHDSRIELVGPRVPDDLVTHASVIV